MLLCFSVYTNSKKLFSSYTGNELNCLSGIKVLSTMWIIFGHRILLNVISGTLNSVYLYEVSQKAFSTKDFIFVISVEQANKNYICLLSIFSCRNIFCFEWSTFIVWNFKIPSPNKKKRSNTFFSILLLQNTEVRH